MNLYMLFPNFSVLLGSWPHVCFSSWIQHVFPAWNQVFLKGLAQSAHSKWASDMEMSFGRRFLCHLSFYKTFSRKCPMFIIICIKEKQTYISKRHCEDFRWLCWGLGKCQVHIVKYLLSYSQNLFPFPQVVSSLSLNVYFSFKFMITL